MPATEPESPDLPPVHHARLLLAVLALAAYAPTFWCGFVYDDDRFVSRNEAVLELTFRNVVRYFTDPTTVASQGTEGIYRPLRTLDFAIDWAVSGGSPAFFHLRNLVYHVLGCLLLLAVLRTVLRRERAAFLGAAAFALHPVHAESVAWISSRADLLLLVWFLLALLLHLRGRPIAALAALAAALLSKESAVVFPAAALLSDRLAGNRVRWRAAAAYAAVAAVYVVGWTRGLAGGDPLRVGHLAQFWGGSWGACLLVMSKGFLYYGKLVLFPVELVVDYHIPTGGGLDGGAAAGILVLTGVAGAALAAGPRSRFALAWFFVTILPASNLIRPIGIPTAERFLYLPLAGVAAWAGPVLARRGRSAFAVLACFLLLTLVRTLDWRTNDTLWDATERVAPTPRSLAHRVNREFELTLAASEELEQAPAAERPRIAARMEAHARIAIARAEELVRLYEEEIRLPAGQLGSGALTNEAKVLILLGRPRAALESIDRALALFDAWGEPYYQAAVALYRLERHEEAALNMEAALAKSDGQEAKLAPQIARLWNLSAAAKETRNLREEALRDYRRSWSRFPDPAGNAEAAAGIRRLE